ncbi:MAG: hypothetical protein ACREPM_11220, partial [Gemmatimonadaceae bacterium]
WYAQQVERRRDDVTIVTLPLLDASWYVAELERRQHLDGTPVGPDTNHMLSIAHALAQSARVASRPVAVALTVPEDSRRRLGDSWTVVGVTALSRADSGAVVVDSQRTRGAMLSIRRMIGTQAARPSVDPAGDYFMSVLSCPRLILDRAPTPAAVALRDTTCNVPR